MVVWLSLPSAVLLTRDQRPGALRGANGVRADRLNRVYLAVVLHHSQLLDPEPSDSRRQVTFP
jgi:hypothetical protein